MSIYNYDDYRAYLKAWIKIQPSAGRGQITQVAKILEIHSTLFSLILSGERELSPDHAFLLSQHLALTNAEADYFMLLVQAGRAGNHLYKKNLKEKIIRAQKQALNMSTRFDHEKKISAEERAIFYSSWLYSAIRLYCSTSEKGKTLEEIASRFSITRPKAHEYIEFLVSASLIFEEKGRYKMGVNRTFLEHGSPHLLRHHTNWRMKALQKSELISESELMFTAPMSIAKADFGKLREELADFLKRMSGTIKDSPAEELACLNIDFFWIEK